MIRVSLLGAVLVVIGCFLWGLVLILVAPS